MLTRDQISQIVHILKPIKARVANTIARAVIQNVDDSKLMQILQLAANKGEDIDDAEHLQQYGFKSVPLSGAEAVVIFPNGDRGHPLVIATDDRRYRPVDWDDGDVGIYDSSAATVRLKGSDIEINPGSGGTVYIRNPDGSAEELVRKSEFDAHVHPSGTGPTGVPTIPAVGTPVLKA